MIQAKGHNGQIQFDGVNVTISRKGVLGFLTQGLKGDKVIKATAITSVQFKKVGMITSGYIQFSVMGGGKSKGGVFDATQDENTVMFVKKQEKDFERIRDAVQAVLNAPTAGAVAQTSVVDQLEKLAQLHERGVLTDSEFQAQKPSFSPTSRARLCANSGHSLAATKPTSNSKTSAGTDPMAADPRRPRSASVGDRSKIDQCARAGVRVRDMSTTGTR